MPRLHLEPHCNQSCSLFHQNVFNPFYSASDRHVYSKMMIVDLNLHTHFRVTLLAWIIIPRSRYSSQSFVDGIQWASRVFLPGPGYDGILGSIWSARPRCWTCKKPRQHIQLTCVNLFSFILYRLSETLICSLVYRFYWTSQTFVLNNKET